MKKSGKIKLSALLIGTISVGIVFSIAACALFFARSYKNALFEDAYTFSSQTVAQTSYAVENYIDKLRGILTSLSKDIDEGADILSLQNKISAAAGLENDIYAVMVYDSDGALLVCAGNGGTLKQQAYTDLSFDKELFSSAVTDVITAPHVQTMFENSYPWVVTIARRSYSQLFGRQVYVAIDFRFSDIAKYIDKVGIGQHGYSYIVESSGEIVYHPQQQMIFSGLEKLSGVAKLTDGVHRSGDNIYTLKSISNSSWRVVGVSYNDEITQTMRRQVGTGIIFSLFCCILVSFIIAKLLHTTLTKPVRALVREMKKFENDAENYRYSKSFGNVAELQTLSDSFEHMVNMIGALMEKVQSEQLVLRKTELRALQAQINPHFLYNTLDSIQWMCERGNNDDAVKMVGALARLFRISISRGEELITIKEELDHAKSYLIIQSFRYKNQFTYEFNADEALYNCLCSKITIQPFIENAIYHGIERMVDPGKITVSVKSCGENDILITVADNGVGMTSEQCRSILEKEKTDSQGIGVKNVNDRIKIHFGADYGITIDSEPDRGTTVCIRIPRIEKGGKNEN